MLFQNRLVVDIHSIEQGAFMRAIEVTSNSPQLRPEWEKNSGAQAIQALVDVCIQHRGGSTYPIIDFLLGLYNGELWKPDMQLLCRRIDTKHFDLVLKAMMFIRQTNKEPHELFVHGNKLFDRLKEFAPRWIIDEAEHDA